MRRQERRKSDERVLRGEKHPGESRKNWKERSLVGLAHRYVKGEVALHLHVRGMSESRKFCVVFEGAESHVHRHPGSGIAGQDYQLAAFVPSSSRAQVEVIARTAEQMQQPMAVEASQIVEPQKAEAEFVSVVRLHRLDDCLSLIGKVGRDLEGAAIRRELPAPVLCEVTLPLRIDREGRIPVCLISGKPPREMIQGGPRVLQKVASNRSDIGGNFLADLDAILSTFRLCVSDNAIRGAIQERRDFPFERIEVLLRPQELYQKPLIDVTEFIPHEA